MFPGDCPADDIVLILCKAVCPEYMRVVMHEIGTVLTRPFDQQATNEKCEWLHARRHSTKLGSVYLQPTPRRYQENKI